MSFREKKINYAENSSKKWKFILEKNSVKYLNTVALSTSNRIRK
jgi:hypothetical protein